MNVEALFAGLPNTGKTTYLALLYQAIVDGKAGPICLGRFDDDRRYVNEISAALLACEPAEHTEVEDREELSLSLTAAERDLGLRIPDLSGEVWDHALDERRWKEELDERIHAAVGLLVFVHAQDLETAVTIAEAKAAAAALGDDGHGEILDAVDPGGAGAASSPVASASRDTEAREEDENPPPRKRQTQVSLVDLIQLLVARSPVSPVRLSLIVSAWDLVGPALTPAQWVHRNCPLLEQYLRQNKAQIDLGIWGVSAQGGDFGDAESLAVLLEQDAVDRAKVRAEDGSDGQVHDPLAWALSLD